jgi:hypothetical protein
MNMRATIPTLVAIDPRGDSIVGRYSLEGASHPHGLSIDPERRLLFMANEEMPSCSSWICGVCG